MGKIEECVADMLMKGVLYVDAIDYDTGMGFHEWDDKRIPCEVRMPNARISLIHDRSVPMGQLMDALRIALKQPNQHRVQH